MVDVSKLSKQAPGVPSKSLQCVSCRRSDGIPHFFCWPILAFSSQLLASNGSVVESRDPNLVFGNLKAICNKLFLSSITKCTV
ncbi:hypothetical protein TNCV_1421321 [Trichonephila clavipes]|nr:hypothetical protein TNCV_1421321 [Trichonephila clavipes]